jgi:predicted PurR-regulated permease PerM
LKSQAGHKRTFASSGGAQMKPWKVLVSHAPEKLSSEEPATTNAREVGAAATQTPQRNAWAEDKKLSLIVLLTLTLVAAYLTYIVFRPFLTALFVALVMAIGFAPPHKWISQRVGNRSIAALITTALAIFLVLVPLTLVSARLAVEATTNYQTIMDKVTNAGNRLDPVIHLAAEQTGIPASQLKADVNRRVREMGVRLVGIAGTLAQHFAQQMTTLLLGSLFLFPLLRSSDQFRYGALSVLPLSADRARELAIAVNQGIIANIYGMLAVAVAEGVLIAIGFWFSGLRSPVLWGGVATVLALLPYVGVSLVWIPACILLIMREHVLSGVLLCVWCLAVVSTADGVIRAAIISGHLKINSFLVTLSIMGGLAVFGPMGFFVGPVILVVFDSLLRILQEEHATMRAARN